MQNIINTAINQWRMRVSLPVLTQMAHISNIYCQSQLRDWTTG